MLARNHSMTFYWSKYVLETFFLTLNRYFSLENLFVIKIVILYYCASPLPSTTSETSLTGNEPTAQLIRR